jgi:hypothetical protein
MSIRECLFPCLHDTRQRELTWSIRQGRMGQPRQVHDGSLGWSTDRFQAGNVLPRDRECPLRSRMMRPVSQVTGILTGADEPYSLNVPQADHLAKQGF